MVRDLLPPPGETGSAAYPLTLPSSLALFGTSEAMRYRCFLRQLQAAIWGSGADDAEVGTVRSATTAAAAAEAHDEAAAAVGGFPSLLQLAEVLARTSSEGNAAAAATLDAAGVEVAGPSTPVSLRISHTADPVRHTITLHCRALNRTVEELRGLEVRTQRRGRVNGLWQCWVPAGWLPHSGGSRPLRNRASALTGIPALSAFAQVEVTAGGPLAASSRRPLVFKLEPLPPADGTSWEASLRVAGFGWPTVQATLRLPVKLAAGGSVGSEPAMRCRPYTISPLQLLAPPSAALSPAEFFQLWQALPHRATLAGVADAGAGPDGGAARVLAGIEAAAAGGLRCVHRAAAPAASTTVTAFYGTSWEGHAVAVIVVAGPQLLEGTEGGSGKEGAKRGGTAVAAAATVAATAPARLQFFFRSEAAEMIAHLRGHQAELLDQLTGGLVIPAASGDEAAQAAMATAAVAAQSEESAARVITFSFLRSYTTRGEPVGGGRQEEDREEEGEEEDGVEPFAVEQAAVAMWAQLRAAARGMAGTVA